MNLRVSGSVGFVSPTAHLRPTVVFLLAPRLCCRAVLLSAQPRARLTLVASLWVLWEVNGSYACVRWYGL